MLSTFGSMIGSIDMATLDASWPFSVSMALVSSTSDDGEDASDLRCRFEDKPPLSPLPPSSSRDDVERLEERASVITNTMRQQQQQQQQQQ
jgi:hypothetical protein